MTTLVHAYGFRPTPAARAILETQALLAHRYYCDLLDLEIKTRNAYRAARATALPELAAAEARLEKLEDTRDKVEIAERKTLRARTKDLRAEFAALMAPADEELAARAGKPSKEQRAGKSIQEIRGMLLGPHEQSKKNAEALESMLVEVKWPELWKQLASLEKNKKDRIKELRHASGIAHGTYIAVENDVQRALQTSQGDPHFPRWNDGKGARKVGVQLLNPKRLLITDEGPRYPNSKGITAIKRNKSIQINIGNDQIIEGMANFHRPLPSDAQILWVYFVPGHRIGRWELQLTIRTGEVLDMPDTASGTARMTLAHELTGNGALIVGKIWFTKYSWDPIYLVPEHVRNLTERPESLRAARDMIFNHVREEWLGYFGGTDRLPAWQRTLCSKIAKGKSPDDPPEETFVHPSKWRGTWKLRRIADTWVERLSAAPTQNEHSRKLEGLGLNTKEGPEFDVKALWAAWKAAFLPNPTRPKSDLYQGRSTTIRWGRAQGLSEEEAEAFWLYTWARKDRHLEEIEVGTRSRALRRKKYFFRGIARDLERRFTDIEVEKPELKEIALRPKRGEELTPEQEEDRRWRFVAGGYLLVDCLKQAFGRERCHVVTQKKESSEAQEKPSATG